VSIPTVCRKHTVSWWYLTTCAARRVTPGRGTSTLRRSVGSAQGWSSSLGQLAQSTWLTPQRSGCNGQRMDVAVFFTLEVIGWVTCELDYVSILSSPQSEGLESFLSGYNDCFSRCGRICLDLTGLDQLFPAALLLALDRADNFTFRHRSIYRIKN
jgi:hypothetical protein